MRWLETFILSLIALTTCTASTATIQRNESSIPTVAIFSKDLLPINFTDTSITKQINYGLNSLNISEIKVNITLNNNENSMKTLNNNNNFWEFEKSLKYLFKNTITADWHMKNMLKDIGLVVNNVTVHEILYETLWEELKGKSEKNNPFSYIELYTDIKRIVTNFGSSFKLQQLLINIEKDLVEYSANLLQSYFIYNSTVNTLLNELKNLSNLYHITIPLVFDKIITIEKPSLIAEELLKFDSKTSEAVYNHISYLKHLNSANEIVPNKIYDNLEYLIAQIDFTNISAAERKKSSKLLPYSMANLFKVDKICFKNITNNFYLYECPQTYLMCTNQIENDKNPLNRKKAAFKVERVGGNAYALHSQYWSRYLRLQSNNPKNILLSALGNNTNNSYITKNLYSHAESSSWRISFKGIYVTLQDTKEMSYVCGGDPTFWSDSENYAYTRKVNDLSGKEDECLWLVEDCSNVD